MALIEVEKLFYRYQDGTEALRGISLQIAKGKKVALLGPNGAGKSTVLLHFNGIYLAQEGEIRYNGELINTKNERWLRSKVGMVFQDPDDQVFSSTVWEDVSFGPTNLELDHTEVEKRVHDALAAVGMLSCRDKAPHHLSYGQKKKVAIAGVLAMDPEVIILDEPAAFLDPQGKASLFGILDNLNSNGATIIIATHDVDLAAEWADEVIVIKEGSCLAQGGTELLIEATIVNEAQLQFPIITRLFQNLPELGLKVLPKTIAEAVPLIRKLIKPILPN